MSPGELRAEALGLRRLADTLDVDAARLALVAHTSLGESAWWGGSADHVREQLSGGGDSHAGRLRAAATDLRRAADALDVRAADLETAIARARQADEARTRPRLPDGPPVPAPVPEVVR